MDHDMQEVEQQPIAVQLVGDHGLVWSISDVLRLRRQHRLVGSMIGGVAGYKSQVSVGGLPLQLSAEEVALALKRGWIRLEAVAASALEQQSQAASQQQQKQQYNAAVEPASAPSHTAATQAAAPGSQPKEQQQQQCGQQQPADVEELDEFYAAYYGLNEQQLLQQRQQQEPIRQQQQQVQQQQQQQDTWDAPWSAAVSSGAFFELPLTVEQLNNSCCAGVGAGDGDGGTPGRCAWPLQPVEQLHHQQASTSLEGPTALAACPADAARQALRNAVFEDLHARGLTITSGGKFGGDWLAYPGDPALYHSHYVVRLAAPGQALDPVVLRAVARGVHTARKHLLLATLAPAAAAVQSNAGCQEGRGKVRVRYITIAKSDGFGGSR